MLLALVLVFSYSALTPERAYADDPAQDINLRAIWVVPEVISGARQPASGGMFAWVTFDYNYYGNELAADLDAADFELQQKTDDGWQTVPGNNIAVLGGDEYYIASFEAIIAARVPDNTDPFIKKWRVVYKPDSASERIESEIIVQAAALEETDEVTAFSREYCADFRVEQAPWSYAEYQADHIPPVYIAYVYPDVTTTFRDPGLIKGDEAGHKIVIGGGAGVSFPMGEEGRSFETEYFNMTGTDLSIGDPDEGYGISGLVEEWTEMKESGMWPGAGSIPEAEALCEKLRSVTCVPDENADEYLSYVVEGTNVFWVSGAGTPERAALGVTDYILVVVRDWESYGTVKHDWSNAPVWEWKGSDETGYTAASARFTCGNHEGHVSTVRTVVRRTDDGDTVTYTATAVFNGKTYTDTKTVPVTDDEEDYKAPATSGDKESAPSAKKAVTIKSGTVTAAAVKKAIKAGGGKATTLVLGSGVKKIGKNALKGTKIKTVVVKTKKLKKNTVRGSLKGSKVATVQVKVGSKKLNKKYIKKYKKIFTKKNAGKKVKVK